MQHKEEQQHNRGELTQKTTQKTTLPRSDTTTGNYNKLVGCSLWSFQAYSNMAANAQITVEPSSGSKKESFWQFEQIFRGFIGVAGIAAGQQANFLQLHLRDAALRYFQTLPAPTRADVDLSLTALRDHFCNQDLQEVHVLKLEQLRFDPKKDTPENFLVNLQTKAQRAYPTPILPAVQVLALPGDAGPLDAAEQTRFDGETAARAARLQAAEANKNSK